MAAVAAMQQAGVVMGKKSNRLYPKGDAIRAELCAMLSRCIKLAISLETAQDWAADDAGDYHYYKGGKSLAGEQTIGGVKYSFDGAGALRSGGCRTAAAIGITWAMSCTRAG